MFRQPTVYPQEILVKQDIHYMGVLLLLRHRVYPLREHLGYATLIMILRFLQERHLCLVYPRPMVEHIYLHMYIMLVLNKFLRRLWLNIKTLQLRTYKLTRRRVVTLPNLPMTAPVVRLDLQPLLHLYHPTITATSSQHHRL